MDVRPPRLSDIRECGLDRVVGPNLSQSLSSCFPPDDHVSLTVSISTTVRKAFSERPEIGARKLPAAPIVTKPHKSVSGPKDKKKGEAKTHALTADDKVNLAVNFYALLCCCFECVRLANIDGGKNAFPAGRLRKFFCCGLAFILSEGDDNETYVNPRLAISRSCGGDDQTYFRPRMNASAPCFI